MSYEEELENAKNKDKLSVQDTSTYMKLYDDWKGAKGDKATKDAKLKGLRVSILAKIVFPDGNYLAETHSKKLLIAAYLWST